MIKKAAVVVCVIAYINLMFSSSTDGSVFRDHRQAQFSRQLTDYVIVVPRKVTAEGKFLSHDLHHQYSAELHRRRRSVDGSGADSVHYHIPLVGQDVLLTLQPNPQLLAQGLLIERRNSKLNSTSGVRIKTPTNRLCFYHGSTNGPKGYQAALSTCYGLRGVVRTLNEDYFIEPLKGYMSGNGSQHPHMVYKRSAMSFEFGGTYKPSHDRKTEGMCGNEGPTTSFIVNRKRWEKRSKKRKTPRRRKRSISVERNVETLVVADKMMMDYYSNEDIETYILTVMNMVSSLYHDASIGNAINVILVRMILLETEEDEKKEDLSISHHADNTLKSFCKWQKYVNPKDENHPNHHDVAILLTRYNICTRVNEPCSTLGLAEVAGMCQPHRSCNVNEDTGLALAYTIAHEMGHNFGMSHDGPHNGCQAPLGERQHVMSPHLNSDASPLVWSNCSRTEITKFLDRDWGSCLDDEPSEHDFTFPELPPGAMYDADHQCRLQYGPSANFCEGIEDVCQILWCRQDNKCVTRLEPAAEGTLCDRNMWCYMGKCTIIGERSEAIDGEWGPWSSWSECSRTCGAGIEFSERHCDNPMPACGGRFCIGERKRYRVCSTKSCEENAPSFRAVQCGEFNNVPYKEEMYTWLPVSTPLTPCQLHCKPEGKFFSVMLSDTVQDGTPCNPGTYDMCINGKCRKVACDWNIDSEAQEDRCGICHGDGTQCQTIRGKFDQKQGLGYVEAVKIPKGARNIRVEELADATNYISVGGENGKFHLNGQWFIQWSGEHPAVGTVLYYQRDGEKETLHAPGPINETIRILLLFQTENPGLTYEYTIPNTNASRKPEFHWEYTDWSVCSATCGGGIQVSRARCIEKEAGLVEDKYCDPDIKPSDNTRICNKHQCPARWWAGPWQHCSVTCGNNGVRRRTVICVRSLGPDEQIALLDEDCDDLEKPSVVEPCHHKQPCLGDAVWETGEWSRNCKKDPCNYQTRPVYCNIPNGHCDEKQKPLSRRQCSNITCGVWIVGNWSECSCGSMQLRNVTCRGGLMCHQATEPTSIRKCNPNICGTDIGNITNENTNIALTENDTSITNEIPQENFHITSNEIEQENAVPENFTVHKHRHHHGNGSQKHGDGHKHLKCRKNECRPHKIAKDLIFIPVYEVDSPKNENQTVWANNLENENYITNEGRTMGKITKEPAIVPEQINNSKEAPDMGGHKYEWKIGVWSKCSQPCDSGTRTREAMCFNMITKHMVVVELCDQYNKPVTVESCNTDPCLEWVLSEWSPCSANCGEGKKYREVHCPMPDGCNPKNKPEKSAACTVRACLDWVAGPWSQCSSTCGGGYQIRHIKCVNLTSQEPATGCNSSKKPSHRQPCNNDECPDNNSAFSQCHDKLEASLCKSLQHMCSTWYFKVKCCYTCNKHAGSKNRRRTANHGV